MGVSSDVQKKNSIQWNICRSKGHQRSLLTNDCSLEDDARYRLRVSCVAFSVHEVLIYVPSQEYI